MTLEHGLILLDDVFIGVSEAQLTIEDHDCDLGGRLTSRMHIDWRHSILVDKVEVLLSRQFLVPRL